MRAIHHPSWLISIERACQRGTDKSVIMTTFIAVVWLTFIVAWIVALW